MDLDKAKELIDKYTAGQCTDEEKIHFEQLLNTLYLQWPESALNQDLESVKQEIYRHLPSPPKKPHKDNVRWTLGLRLAVAGALILIAASGIYFWSGSRKNPAASYNAIRPASNKAKLILSNGTRIDLSIHDSTIVTNANGIRYSNGSIVSNQSSQELTLVTPKGGIYQAILPDGTKVWLNAASTLKYPSNFSANNRIVDLEGEAFFEVSQEKGRMFMVKTPKQQITVLGTSFNVNAYQESTSVTTLVSGSVRIKSSTSNKLNNQQEKTLIPGEQALSLGDKLITQQADLESELAWREGQFVFNDEPLEAILIKLSRWYDMEVEYKGADPEQRFGGSISRFENVSAVLGILELTKGVHFKIEGRKIVVIP